jgi:hypothetical protein
MKLTRCNNCNDFGHRRQICPNPIHWRKKRFLERLAKKYPGPSSAQASARDPSCSSAPAELSEPGMGEAELVPIEDHVQDQPVDLLTGYPVGTSGAWLPAPVRLTAYRSPTPGTVTPSPRGPPPMSELRFLAPYFRRHLQPVVNPAGTSLDQLEDVFGKGWTPSQGDVPDI